MLIRGPGRKYSQKRRVFGVSEWQAARQKEDNPIARASCGLDFIFFLQEGLLRIVGPANKKWRAAGEQTNDQGLFFSVR